MLVNHTINNLSQGVSQQHEEARFETQVSEMVNCIPDISRGVFRRNPVTTIDTINTTAFNSNPDFYTYFYDRGDTEKYCVTINNNNELSVVDIIDGTTKNTLTSAYLSVGVADNVHSSFVSMTIGDFTFISNKTKTGAMSATVNGTAGSNYKEAIYWVKDVTSVETLIQSQSGTSDTQQVSDYEGYTYSLNGTTVKGEKTYTWNSGTSTFDLTVDRITASQIATQLASSLGADYEAVDGYVYWKGTGEPTNWTWGDNLSNSVSFGFNGEVSDASKLPASIPDTIVDYYNTTYGSLDVYVTGGTSDGIGYWLTYVKGVGWEEGRQPGMANTLDASTMPHVLVRGSDGNFYLKEYTTTAIATIPGQSDTDLGWKPRLVGDIATAVNPSMVGNTITELFYHKSRIGFVAKDSIVLSKVNSFGTLYPTSIRALVDDDVIDIAVASKELSILRYVIELADRLIVFSDDAQYIVSSGDTPLTPSTAAITTASRYNILPSVRPIIIGDSAFFISSVGQAERLYKYSLSQTVTNKFVAVDVSMHVPSYLQGTTYKLIGHSTIGYTFMLEYNSNTIYVYNGTMIGDKSVQSAMHKWTFQDNIVGGAIVDNALYLVFAVGDELVLTTVQLSTPVDFTTITYTDTIGVTPYNYSSLIEFSEWQIKQEEMGTSRGRLQIRTLLYSLDDSSKYTTVLTNRDLIVTAFESVIKLGTWDDTNTWNDAAPWSDTGYQFSRKYTNDSLITVMGNNKSTKIEFTESENEPTEGFNLKTLNLEGMFYQRSKRY